MRKRLLLGALSGVLLLSTLDTGSRGPTLAIGVAVFGVLITAPAFRKFRKRAIFGALTLAGIVLYVASQRDSDGLTRIIGFLSGGVDNSINVRGYLLSETLRNIDQYPFGIGWGNFVTLPNLWRFAAGDRLYSHNTLAEVTIEAGWIAGLAVIVYLSASLLHARKCATDTIPTVIYGLLIFFIANAMTSGDINDNRVMWIMLSCAWAYSVRERIDVTPAAPPARIRA